MFVERDNLREEEYFKGAALAFEPAVEESCD